MTTGRGTITNPTVDQIEVGGVVSGLIHGLPFVGWPVTSDGRYLRCGPWPLNAPNDALCDYFVITSYTPYTTADTQVAVR